VVVELEFATTEQAEACCAALDRLWTSGLAAPALVGTPQRRIVERSKTSATSCARTPRRWPVSAAAA